MHALCDNKHKHNASTQLSNHKCIVYIQYKPHMMHNHKVVKINHNVEGIWRMMSNTGFVKN